MKKPEKLMKLFYSNRSH